MDNLRSFEGPGFDDLHNGRGHDHRHVAHRRKVFCLSYFFSIPNARDSGERSKSAISSQCTENQKH